MAAAPIRSHTGRRSLSGAGELASKIIDQPDMEDADDASEQIQDVIGEWTLSVGDTIKIEEVAA